MMPIDTFIHQLIRLGLADSFLEIIQKHYLKVTEIYNLLMFIDENNIRDMYITTNNCNDGFTLLIEIYNPVDLNEGSYQSNDFSIQIINKSNMIELTIVNNYESEDEVYEIRLSEHGKVDSRKWS